MSSQIIINLLLSAATVYLAYRSFVMESQKESRKESTEMVEIRVQLSQVMELLRDLQADVKAHSKDYQELSERIAVIETKLTDAIQQIDEIKKELHNGKVQQ